ncbi:MAG: sigma-54-dependent Fis family transcriptional regulator [Deltaproteobacteria bacterium]|nr:sigma-54-dependent Fis family transcriptional regulator [Deltaproteobacteria bacterium]MBW2051240.1 sigma-54-dependent Fis family transcriptional regulator [Deltaproteobacteria bacterium]MBW2141161.1 sigma-54-dependent Fis family transcriptional regulator [Deltaproteobacteria bacterium]MBW2322649.1 sigma-54-dependent Fis family transcriptional regulator [Deltaproteobacteria bacterium]
MNKKILVVDDEEDIRQSLEGILRDEGFDVTLATNGAEVLDRIQEDAPDLVLLDIWMEGSEQGLDVLKHLQKEYPFLPVVMISGHGNIETAVRATKLGAYDYIEKPLSYDKILLVIEHCLNYHRLAEENIFLKNITAKRFKLTGKSPVMRNLKQQIEIVAPTNAWVLITGKNGTGKELVAHTIHRLSKRADRPMVEVNCAAIPEELIESELFGHEKGAFTGADQPRRGQFDLANHGTLFLDEIGDMSLKTQSKILRILQEQKLQRVGGTKTIQVDVRVIAATNKHLETEIARGNFREDLYYRLNVIPIHVPPLNERKEDIPRLVQDFLEEFSRENNTEPKTISQEALETMTAHDWPGNVRELKNFVERLVIMTPGPVIESDSVKSGLGFNPSHIITVHDILNVQTLKEAKTLAEKEFIRAKLAVNNGNVTQTAEAIGLDRTSLHKKIKSLGLNVETD